MTGCSLNYHGCRRKRRDFCREEKDGALSTCWALQKAREEQQFVASLSGRRQEVNKAQRRWPSPPPAPKEAKQVPWSRLCSQGSVRMHWAPSRLKGWAAAPALNISPTDRHRALQLGVRKCLLVASLLRDITKCPGDSDTGRGRAVGTCDYPSPRTGSLPD